MQQWLFIIALVLIGSTNATYCDNPFPGAKKLLSGIDLAFLDLSGIKGNMNRKHGMFEFTCNEKRKMHFAGKEWDRPDQVEMYSEEQVSDNVEETEIIKSENDISKSNIKGLNLMGDYGPVTGALSAGTKKLKNQLKNGTNIVSRAEKKDITMRVEMRFESNFSRGAVAFIDNLSKSFKADPDPYNNFIKMYGTHYMSVINLGGIVVQETVTKKSYLKSHTEDELSAGLNFKFLKFLGLDGKYKKTSKKNLEDIRSLSKTSTYVRGGNAHNLQLNKPGFLNDWQKTVTEHPTIIKAQYMPVTTLLKDKNKKEQMKQAIDKYFKDIFYKKMIENIDEVRARDGLEQTISLKHLADRLNSALNGAGSRPEMQEVQQQFDDYEMRRKETLVSVWTLSLRTCDKRFAGTNSPITVNIKGKEGRTGILEIPSGGNVQQLAGPSKDCYANPMERGCVDKFELNPANKRIGDIREVEIYNKGKGFASDWDLCGITVTHGKEVKKKEIPYGLEVADKKRVTISF